MSECKEENHVPGARAARQYPSSYYYTGVVLITSGDLDPARLSQAGNGGKAGRARLQPAFLLGFHDLGC